jgi:hypothetical protein
MISEQPRWRCKLPSRQISLSDGGEAEFETCSSYYDIVNSTFPGNISFGPQSHSPGLSLLGSL